MLNSRIDQVYLATGATDLPVERIEYTLTEEEKICPICNNHLHQISKEIRKELKVIPAQVVVVEHVKNIYVRIPIFNGIYNAS